MRRLQLVILALSAAFPVSVAASPAAADPRYYDMGNPGPFTDLYLSPTGSDGNSGTTRDRPLRTIGAAWARIPGDGALAGTGYRLNFLPGAYPCEGGCLNYFADRIGTYQRPVIMRPADGPGTVTIRGGLNLHNVHYLYLLDLKLQAGGSAGAFDNNVLHLDASDHVLMRGLTVTGLVPDAFQEVIKANQCQHLYVEDSDVSGTYQTGLDYFSVQYGHILNSKFHDSRGWAMYLKGGSAYFRVEGNEFYDCWLGFSAGEGSNFEVMQSPWIHYEAYDIKFVNNVMHDIPGVALAVAGGYDIFFAYNTLYRVATDSSIGYPLLEFVYGGRSCIDFDPPDGAAGCAINLGLGGWGRGTEGEGGEFIPDRNVYVYNNIIYNPAPARTAWSHLDIRGPVTPPSGSNIPSPARTDQGLRIRGNIIWNGPADMPTGIGESTGCQSSNPTCNEAQLRGENLINALQPQLVNPDGGDFRPVTGGNVFSATVFDAAAFTRADAPSRPPVPVGDLSNNVPVDRAAQPRSASDPPGAYAGTPSGEPDPIVNGISPESGPVAGGTSVAISGANFRDAAAATIGGIAASSVVVVSSSSITCLTPPHAAGPVDVIVTNTDGRRGALSGGYTYVDEGEVTHRLTVTITGRGRVTGMPGGISCPGTCASDFAEGTSVTLSASPASGWRFQRWRGGCARARTCALTMTTDRSVRAIFKRR